MHADSPWFKFWPKDFLADVNVAAMSLDALGAYMRLLCYCWTDGGVPADADSLARLWGVDAVTAEGLRDRLEPLFIPHEHRNGWWAHPRIERERADQRRRSQQATRAAGARWGHTPDDSEGNAHGPPN